MKVFTKQSGFVAEYTKNQNKKIIKLQAENKRLKAELEKRPEDWDAHIANVPEPKRKGIIKAVFRYIGKSKP